ncbi:hypothetical protein HK098_005729 [Nowakowskiella sp. JEL0407]|nr:hypothetical protein HK098_005729 [Nowakowskiella sp. JEL0407]
MALPSNTSPPRSPERDPSVIRGDSFWGNASMAPSSQNGWVEVGRTEIVRDNLSPKFLDKITMPYIFEERQLLRFFVIDVHGTSTRIEDHNLLGVYETTLASIVTASGKSIMKPLKHPKGKKNNGFIFVVANEVVQNKSEVHLHMVGKKLDKKDWFGKSDPYFVMNRGIGKNSVAIYQSEVIRKTINPDWKPFSVGYNDLCGDSEDATLVIDVYDWDKGSEPEFIGSATTTLSNLLDSKGNALPITNSNKRNSDVAGFLQILNSSVEPIPTFLDYIAGGTEINVVVGIDFTGSNGDPRDVKSLHYQSRSGRLNKYQRAVKAVAGVLESYDNDQRCAAYGFGAVYNGEISHCFPLNGNEKDPTVFGVDGILEAYSSIVPQIEFSGPTNFAPLIELVSAQIRSGFETSALYDTYTFLLILTDGEITDMNETIDAIVMASDLPLSIVIVGIGHADFSKMDQLDGDSERLQHSTKKIEAKRDIVQFVPFSSFSRDEVGLQLLAKEVLAEIPGQITSYYKSKGIKPNPPRPSSVFSDMTLPRADQIDNEDNMFIELDERGHIRKPSHSGPSHFRKASNASNVSVSPNMGVVNHFRRSAELHQLIENLPPPYTGA